MKIAKLLGKVIGVYGIFFIASVLVAVAVLHTFQIKDTALQVLVGYAFGLAGCVPSTIVSLAMVLREENL
jgi:hypothetical protein